MKRITLALFLLFAVLAPPSKAQIRKAALATPTVNTAGTNLHSVSLSCTETSMVVGFNFWRGTVSGGPYTKLNSALVPSCGFTDTTGVGGTTYFYVATAVDSSGSESVFSNEKSALFLGAPAAPVLSATSN